MYKNVTKHEQAKSGTYKGWTLSWRAVEIVHTLLKIAEGQLGRVGVHTQIEIHTVRGSIPEDYLLALSLLELEWKH